MLPGLLLAASAAAATPAASSAPAPATPTATAPIATSSQASARVEQVVAALRGSTREDIPDRLARIAPSGIAPDDSNALRLWALEIVAAELRTGHGGNDAWSAFCNLLHGDGAWWADSGSVAFELAASDRSGLLGRALDGNECGIEILEAALDWAGMSTETFLSCESPDDGREIASITGTLDDLGARLASHGGDAIADDFAKTLQDSRMRFESGLEACRSRSMK